MRFGEKCTQEYSRLQLKTRFHKIGESLEELPADIQRLSQLAFSDCPIEVRQHLGPQCFIGSVRDMETQKALRLADVKDIEAALVHAYKIEAAKQVMRKDRLAIRATTVQEEADFGNLNKRSMQVKIKLRRDKSKTEMLEL